MDHLPEADNELREMTVSVKEDNNGVITGVPGYYTVVAVPSSTGRVAFWKDLQKNDSYTGSGHVKFGTEFYVEGVHESASIGDVTIFVDFTADDGWEMTENYFVTVTPVFNSITATKTQLNEIFFHDQTNNTGLGGLDSGVPKGFGIDPDPAITIDSDSINVGEIPYYVQNVTIANGFNRGGAGWVYTTGETRNYLPADEGEVFLDSNSNDPTDVRYSQKNLPPGSDPESWVLRTVDWPLTGVPKDPNDPTKSYQIEKTSLIDIKLYFTTYLVVQYLDTPDPNKPGVHSLYPVGKITWEVNFYADTNDPQKGVTMIQDLVGVRKEANNLALTWNGVKSNEDPWTAPPTFNDGDWR